MIEWPTVALIALGPSVCLPWFVQVGHRRIHLSNAFELLIFWNCNYSGRICYFDRFKSGGRPRSLAQFEAIRAIMTKLQFWFYDWWFIREEPFPGITYLPKCNVFGSERRQFFFRNCHLSPKSSRILQVSITASLIRPIIRSKDRTDRLRWLEVFTHLVL